MAAAAAVAVAPSAWPCDVRGYDAEADRVREGGCATAVALDGEDYHPVDYEFTAATRPSTATAEALPGSGGDDPGARLPGHGADDPDEGFLRTTWSAP